MAQPYVKQEWADKVTVINKARLDHIEEGIYQVSIVQPEKGDPGKDGVTPQFQVADDYIQVSMDSGASWNNLVPLASITGPQGETGEAFSIYKTYPSVDTMNEDAANVPEGSFVLIASTEGDPDNAKLYVKGKDAFSFLTDLSGAQGIQGEPGKDGASGITPVITFHVKTLAAGESATIEQSGSAEAPSVTIGVPRGADGTNGQNGSDGVNGKDGVTFTPSVDENANLSWTNSGELENPPTVNLAPNLSEYTKHQEVAALESRVHSVEAVSGNVYAMQSQIAQLMDQVQQLKTPTVEPVEITEEGATVTQPEQDVSFSGTVAGVVGTITAKSIQSVNASITSGRLSTSATNDVSVKDLVTTGDLQKSVSNAGLSVNTNEYVTITGADWQQTGYNAIEVGLSSAPKSVLIDGIDFKAAMGNNALSIFSWQENAVITISNCHFADVSNPLRLSNRDNKPCTVNIVNCTCDKWTEGEYAGFICMQDYTSKSAQAAQEANQFGKLIINFVNCVAPDGTRITGNAEALYNKHQIYIYTDREGLIPYGDGSRFPQVSAI